MTRRSSASRRATLQRLALGGELEPVARLHLNRGDAFGDQRIEARQRLAQELVLARGARRVDRGDDAASGARDLLIAGAGEPHFELAGAIAGVDEMGVAVDQRGSDPAAVAFDDVRPRAPGDGQIGLWADEGDAAVARCDRAALDDAEARPLGGERRQTRVQPNRLRPRRLARVGHGVCFVSSLAPRFNV